MPEFQLSTAGTKNPPPDMFACLDGKTKSAVTRYYNSISHKSQALVETMQAPKRKKKAKAPPKSLAMEGEVGVYTDLAGEASGGGREEKIGASNMGLLHGCWFKVQRGKRLRGCS